MKKNKRIRIWALIHLINSLLGIVIILLFGWYYPVLPIGSISWAFAFMIGCYSEVVVICWLYSLLFVLLTVFAYIKTFVKGQAIWFFIMCIVDVVAMILLLVFVVEDTVPIVYWIGVLIQIFHAILYFIFVVLQKNTEKQLENDKEHKGTVPLC